jgi:hypothetical protein
MKIDQLIVQHFYIAKQVTLLGIGTFKLSPDFVLPAENDKDIVLPDNAVSFEYNPRATEDEALVTYITQQTRKIKPLASADLESYIMLATQFLNIGKPLKIEGIGILEKNQLGEYLFSQGQFINTKTEQAEVKLKEKSREDVSFNTETSSGINGKKVIAVLASIIAIAGIGFAAWYFLNNKQQTPVLPVVKDIIEQPQPVATVSIDTTNNDITKKDTTAMLVTQKPDSVTQPQAPVVNTGSYTFKVVLKNYFTLAAAQKSFNRLTSYGHKLLLYTTDSVTYKVAMPFTRPLADTTYAKDSIRKNLFGGTPYIEIK